MQNQGEDQPCRIKSEWLPTKHQMPKQGAREFLRLSGVSAEEPHEVARGISGNHRVQNRLPTIGAVAQRRRRRIGQSGRVIGRSPSEPSCVPRNSSRTRPPRPEPAPSGGSMKPAPPRIVVTTLIDIENAAVWTAKPAVYPGIMGKDPFSLNTRNG